MLMSLKLGSDFIVLPMFCYRSAPPHGRRSADKESHTNSSQLVKYTKFVGVKFMHGLIFYVTNLSNSLKVSLEV